MPADAEEIGETTETGDIEKNQGVDESDDTQFSMRIMLISICIEPIHIEKMRIKFI